MQLNDPNELLSVTNPPALHNSETNEISPAVKARVLQSANWFFWIAGLSAINSIVTHAGGQWHFMVGLGLTEVADAVAGQFGSVGTGLAIVFDVLVASIFVCLGLLARRLMLWPFILGMAVYALDGVLLVLLGIFFSAAFHGYVLFILWLGVKALRQIKAAQS